MSAEDVEPTAEEIADPALTGEVEQAETSPEQAENSPEQVETSPEQAETSPEQAATSPAELTTSDGVTTVPVEGEVSAQDPVKEETAQDDIGKNDIPTEVVSEVPNDGTTSKGPETDGVAPNDEIDAPKPAPAGEEGTQDESSKEAKEEEGGEKTVKRNTQGLLRRASKSLLEEKKKRKSITIESLAQLDDSENKIMLEEMKWNKDPAQFYDADDPTLIPAMQENELPREVARPIKFLGFDFSRHYNLVWTSDHELAYVTGQVVVLVDLAKDERRFLHGRDNGGVGCVAMSPDMKYMALGEKSTTGAPNIYIYEYATLRLYRILRKGTERGFASVKFSPHNESHLAALGMFPDYLLSVWDWRNERLLLKCKAYGQDVYNVVWGNYPGNLTTCGTGHIRFWKMATTFTGLKLQGDIGKFGASELSDVSGFVELPDGKVCTGSEYGTILLWEGVFVKVELVKATQDAQAGLAQEGKNSEMHSGGIDVIMLDSNSGCVVSGGDDGFLRWWSVEEIDEAEADYDQGILEYAVVMKKEVRIPPVDSETGITQAACIRHVARSVNDDVWLIQDDRNGVIWKFERKTGKCTSVLQTNAKAISGVTSMHAFPGLVVTSGLDGTLRAFNMTAEKDNELFADRRGGVGIVCMATAPESVDFERRSVACGYADGVVRTFFVCKDGFALVQAVKPHNCAVAQIAYSSDGTLVAVLGVNNVIFYLEVRDRENQLSPLGYVEIPTKVNHITWNDHESGHLLLALVDGTVMEINRPVPEMIDNTETYQMALDYRALLPELPEPESEDEEDDEEEEAEGEGEELPEGEEPKPKLTKEEKKEIRKKEKEAAAAAKQEEEGDAEKEQLPSSVQRVVYLSDDAAIFAGTGRYQGYLWEMPLQLAPVIDHTQTPLGDHTATPSMCTMLTKLPSNAEVTHLSLSPSSDRLLFAGFSDGHVWVLSLGHMQFFAEIGIGDSTRGVIPAISVDAEEQMVIVGGADGSLSAVELNAEGLLEMAKYRAENPEATDPKDLNDKLIDIMENTYKPCEPSDPDEWENIGDIDNPGLVGIPKDISDPSHYSIQDQKLKSEEENAKAAAERQKRRVRDRIEEVRQDLEEVIAKNKNIPYGQLTTEELTIDPEYVAQLNKEMEDQVEMVNQELAWSCEFHERGMQKLKDYFLGRLDFERIEVLAFSSPHRVSTFRCPAMSQELQSNLARLHELIFAADRESDDEEGGGDTSPGGLRQTSNSDMKFRGSNSGRFDGFGEDLTQDGTGSQEVRSGAEQRELRRQQRLQRKQQMQDLEKAKPSDTYEDPQDLEAIAHADATLGNYMLKTSDTYQVPENQRMNAEKKRRQMFLLEESMHAIKTEFNHRVLALRDFRQAVKAEVQRDLTALRDIDQQLGIASTRTVSLLEDQLGAPPEFPERRFDHADDDLKTFARSLKGTAVEGTEEGEERPPDYESDEDEADADQDEDEEDGEDGEEDDGGGDVTLQLSKTEGDSAKKDARKAKKRSSQQTAQKGPILGTSAPISGRGALMARRIDKLTLRAKLLQAHGDSAGALGKAVAQEAHARLWHDKTQLEDHVKQVIDTFDGAVASIEKEKAKLESDLKNADMKLLVLYEELLTLNELEEKDEELLRKATKCRQDKTSIMHQIKDCQDQLGEKKAEIEQWQNEETSLQQEFTELVGESSPFLGALLKIYKKKVKRSKRKKGMGDDDEYDEDEDEDEDEEEDEDDEDVDDEDEDVGPPQGCDVTTYESVLDLREKRLDMEDALQEIQRAVDELKKTHTRLLSDEKRIDTEQKKTDAEIQQFQTDKQRKLNQVEIVFALRLSQVQCLENNEPESEPGCEKLPPELDEHVVFTHEGLNRLMARITELHQEIKDVKANYQQLRKDFKLRLKEQKQCQQHIEDLEAKFQDIQMLKFGQIVDLDLLEKSAPNKYVQELQEKVQDSERDHRVRLTEWEKRIEKQKKELAKVTCDNTSLMEQIVSMGYSQMQLDAALNARIANVTVNDTEPLIDLREMERERLKDLLTLQSKEIATLQAEINLFRKKGGHIYTTVTANRMPEH